ncbi:MAG TPA: N-acetylmuramoyl-L-alanine amidase [Candidatus Saccharimonadales bacterium]|nr:N-acetylmuramoyl-L-alanine amidase [Candidatus Saccharimonadales bacterium]
MALAVSLSIGSSASGLGLTDQEWNRINGDSIYYNGCSNSSSAAVNGSGPTSGGPTIVIDPGHSGDDIHDNDPQTGLYDHDYPNEPEMTEVFDVAQKVQDKLQADGYKVIMTKQSVNDDVSFRERADVANQANADLALSIHDSHDTSWQNMYGSGDGGQVYVQAVGDYRQNKPGMGVGNKKVKFMDNDVAKKSQEYGQIFADQRTKDEDHKVSVAPENFNGRDGLPSGNIPMVQLFAAVPWVYNEVGAPHGKLSAAELDKYAKGIIDGVEKSVPVTASAITTNTPDSGAVECCNNSSSANTDITVPGDADGAKGAWSSGLTGPYIIEQFAINVLEDLAQKKGVPTTDTVTKQHVLALVAWAYIEGGDIANDSLFNLYNSGQRDSGFTAGAHTTDGLGSYVSFDAGVEEITRNIDDGNHNGMVKVLLDPNSSAEDFGHAEATSGTQQGTLIWAAASKDPSYFRRTWAPVLAQTESAYKDYASLQIGTTAHELYAHKHLRSQLSDIGSDGFVVNTGDIACGVSAEGAAGIVQDALKLAWPEPFGSQAPGSEPNRTSALTNTAAYQSALDSLWPHGGAPYNGADCGTFVSAVVRDSGADPNYPPSGTGAQWAYVTSHPKKWYVQQDVTSMSDLQPGDVLIIGGAGGAGAAGHTWIYVGKQQGGYWSASASMGGRSGNLTNDVLTDAAASGNYLLARLK